MTFVHPGKIKKIRRVAEGYMYVNKIENVDCRFDVLTIDMREKIPNIELLRAAF
jgi:Holliday junction resolvase-like predicted endonuclease